MTIQYFRKIAKITLNAPRSLLISFCILFSSLPALQAGELTRLLDQPDILGNKVVFVYAGDLWLVNTDGGQLRRLTSGAETESRPRFSPDGEWIAYTSNRFGNNDVYIISTDGGNPKRLTWHPSSDYVQAWNPSGKDILFTSRREMKQGRSAQLWQISVDGGYPHKVMRAVVQEASWSEDGKRLAYQPYLPAFRGASGWRNHRGGETPPIWIMRPNGHSYVEVPHENASDTSPQWYKNSVIFLSDRTGVRNLYRYEPAGKHLREITDEKDWDIKSFGTDGNRLVYSAGGYLKLFEPESKVLKVIPVVIHADFSEAKPQWKDASKMTESVKLSNSGKRALLSARGDIFTVPLDKGSVRNLTKTDGVRERDALWSVDGKQIALMTDKNGIQSLVFVDQFGKQMSTAYSLGPKADYQLLDWGGSGRFLIYKDNHLTLRAFDTKNKKSFKIDTDNRRQVPVVSQSPDGQWLAYTKMGKNFMKDIYLYQFSSGKKIKLTDGMSSSDYPVFSRDGNYLYFASSTNLGITSTWLDMSTLDRPIRYSIYGVVLSSRGKSPLLALSDEEWESDSQSAGANKEKQSDKKISTIIDVNGLADRIFALPVPSAFYGNLAVAADNNLYYVRYSQPGSEIGTNGQSVNRSNWLRFSFDKREVETLGKDTDSFSLSADGKTAVLVKGTFENGGIKSIRTAGIDTKVKFKKLDTSDVKLFIRPSNEWRQIFDEVWRNERDYFYAENLHRLDWEKVGRRYRALLPFVKRREDLNSLMVDMIAEFQAGHNRTGGGDLTSVPRVPVGLLGANFEIRNGRYSISKIFDGEKWNPHLKSPLGEPGLGIKVDDFIVAIDGHELTADENIYQYLENTVGKQVTLTVASHGYASNPRKKDLREVVVEPVASENQLRLWNWIETNRKLVDKATQGKTGYVYLPDTADKGFTLFNRMFFAQADRQSMIIDDRRNNGGYAANYISDVLTRKLLASWKDRDGLIFNTPGVAVYGPKVMLIDQDAGSGGDFLPYSFKRLGIGKLIGKRTWGGLIGIFANRHTIDRGVVTVPYFRFFTPEGKWQVENEGVSPDIDVTLDPVLVNRGVDAQLNKAIEQVLTELKTFNPVIPENSPDLPTKVGL